MRAAVLVVLLLAGCVSPFARQDAPAQDDEARVSYLHSAMTFATAPERNQSAVRTGGFYEAWAAGEDYPTWFSDPFGRDVLVTEAMVTLFLRATGPVVESVRFPDIMVYGGSGEAWMGFGARTDLVAFEPGRVYEVEVELALPRGGLWLPPDEGFGLKVVPVMLQQDERADVEVLLGGENDTASRVAWRVAPLDLPAATPHRGEAEGEVVGTIYAGPAAPPTTSHRTRLALPPDAHWIVAWMNTTESLGIPDVDLSIEAPNGTTITGSGTPTPQEAIRIAGPNLAGPGDYALVVTTAGSPRAEFRLEWMVGRVE